MFIADKGYNSQPINDGLKAQVMHVVIPPLKYGKEQRDYDKDLYKDRKKVEQFINRLKHYRRVATRYDKSARNFLAFTHEAFAIIVNTT